MRAQAREPPRAYSRLARGPATSRYATTTYDCDMRRAVSTVTVVLLLVLLTGCNGEGGPIEVPDVVGLNETEAVRALEAAGLTAEAAVAAGAVESHGTVVEQDPEPGSHVEVGSVVTLSIAREGL